MMRFGLKDHHATIGLVAFEEFMVGAEVDDPAFTEVGDPVGDGDGAEAVGDDDTGSIGEQQVQVLASQDYPSSRKSACG